MRILAPLLLCCARMLGQTDALAHAEKARQLTVDAKYPAALAEWREAIRLTPSSAMFHNLYGLALAQSGQSEMAQQEFRRALALNRSFADAQSNLAYSLWQSRQNRLAAVEADKAIRLSPSNNSLHLLRAQLYATSEDRPAACREFEKAIPWPKESALLWQIMASCLESNRKLSLQAAELLPSDGESQLMIGRWFLAACDPLKTLAVLSSLETSPEFEYQIEDLRASALLSLGRMDEAAAGFRRLLDRFPDSPAAYVAATQVALQRQNWDEALKTLDAGLTRLPDNWLLLFRRGIVRKLSGHLDEARADFIKSLENHGEVALVAAALGDLEAQTGNLPKAADLFRRTWQDTKLPQFQFAYALALDRLGDSQKALAELRAAAANSPADAQMHYTLGKMLARQSSYKEAQSEFEAARRIAPGMAVNLYALSRVYALQGETTKANEVMAAFQEAKLQPPPRTCNPS